MQTVEAPIRRIIESAYVESCQEFLGAYDVAGEMIALPDTPRAIGGASMCSSLSATGEGIKLLSILQLEEKLLIGLHPSGTSSVSRRDLEDWCGEISNQIVGRLKNKLLRHGFEVSLGLPSVVVGKELNTVTPAESVVGRYQCDSPRGRIAFIVATLLAPGFVLAARAPQESKNVMQEGTVALF
jgi:hypothetical protein